MEAGASIAWLPEAPRRRLAALALAVGLALAHPGARAVIGGVIDENRADSPFAGVGSLSRGSGEVYSAVLIAPEYVLTAAHVVGRPLLSAPLTFTLNVGGDRTFVSPIEEITVHPGYAGFEPGPDGLVRDDIAVLRLSRPAPEGTPIYKLFDGQVQSGQAVLFAGYGAARGDGQLVPPVPSIKRRGESRIDALVPAPGETRASSDVYVFSPTPILGEPQAGLAFGDSGSPTFVREDDGTLALLGINTFTLSLSSSHPQSFVAGGGGILVPSHAQWIRSVVRNDSPARLARLADSALLALALAALAGLLVRTVRRRGR